jgi:hypothetical protein
MNEALQKVRTFVRAHLGAAVAATATAVVLVGGLLAFTVVGNHGPSSAASVTASTTTTTLAPTGAGAGAGAGAGPGPGIV